ncbi:hypothetical protein GCM10023115_51040 [Pontixanthobacter gangjinensis]
MLLLFVGTFTAMANDGLDLKVNQEQSLIVEVKKNQKGAILSLRDEQGEIVFKDFVNDADEYTKVLNFTNLPVGEYSFILEKEFSISTSKIRKNEENIQILEDSYVLVFKPLYKQREEKVLLYLANPEENRVVIKIFDKFGVLVGEISCRDVVIKRTLDFSKVPPGSYFVEIKTKTDNFSHRLNVG